MRFGEEEAILLNLVHLKEEPGAEGETAGSSAAGGMGGAVRRRRRRGPTDEDGLRSSNHPLITQKRGSNSATIPEREQIA